MERVKLDSAISFEGYTQLVGIFSIFHFISEKLLRVIQKESAGYDHSLKI